MTADTAFEGYAFIVAIGYYDSFNDVEPVVNDAKELEKLLEGRGYQGRIRRLTQETLTSTYILNLVSTGRICSPRH